MREPLLAGILSLLIPGLGQLYNGRILIGIIWLVVTGFSWIGSAGMLGWVVHLIAAWCAYSFAKDNPVRSYSLFIRSSSMPGVERCRAFFAARSQNS